MKINLENILFLLFISFCGSYIAQQASIEGKITNQNGESIYNATLSVAQSTVRVKSDPDGNYKLVGIPVSLSKITVEITVKATGYNDLTFSAELEPNVVLIKNLTMLDGVKLIE